MKKQFGKQIKAAREAANLTQVELANRIGVSGQSISRMELGLQALRWRVLEALSENLGQPPAYFFDVRQAPTLQERPAKLELFELVADLTEAGAKEALPAIQAIIDGLSGGDPRKNLRQKNEKTLDK